MSNNNEKVNAGVGGVDKGGVKWKTRGVGRGIVTEMEVYGEVVPCGYDRLGMELKCYRENRGKDKGGVGAFEHFKRAWALAWPNYEWQDWVEMMVWGWCNYERISICGHGASGKTYNMSRIVYLDWLANPFETMTSLTTVTADGLRLRMWGDLMRAHEEMPEYVRNSVKVYSSSNRMNVMLEGAGNTYDKYVIEGMATSKSKDASGRIRGKHAPRRRVVLDEADDMPSVIYETFGNIRTDPDVKIVDMSNAMNRHGNFGQACEPKGGWSTIHDSDLFWETKAGICLHFDGLQNPNMKAHKPGQPKKHPYMLGAEEIANIEKEFGRDSVQWWCFVRGFFPPDGMVSNVWPSMVIDRAKESVVFDFKPEMVASLDPAFEHDDCVLMIGEMGKLRDGRLCINMVKDFRIGTCAANETREPKDYQVANQVKRICMEYGVKPENLIMDKSGGGRGVWAILCKEWSPDVIGINYGGSATDRQMRLGDLDKACDMVQYYVSELWFRARYMAEDGLLKGIGNLSDETIEDLNTRRYVVKQTTDGNVMVVERKIDMKKRLGRSPDFGDALCQMGELLARRLWETVGSSSRFSSPLSMKWQKDKKQARLVSERYNDEYIDLEVL